MLQGSFDTFDFAEVLDMLSRKGQTGKLRVHYGTASIEFFLNIGQLVHAESSDHGTPARVADSRARLEEACFEVLRWEHGGFEFHPGSTPASTRHLDAAVESVLAGARRRLADWERVQDLIPSLDVQPRLVADLASEEIVITRPSWRVLAAVDGRRNGQALGRVLGLSNYEICVALADLVADGLIEINSRPKVSIAPPTPARTSAGLPSVRLPRLGQAEGNPTSLLPSIEATSASPTESIPDPPPSGPTGAPDSIGDPTEAARASTFARLTGRKGRPVLAEET